MNLSSRFCRRFIEQGHYRRATQALPTNLRQGIPSRGLRVTTPVCMGRRSAKIAGRKGAQDSRKSKLWGKMAKLVLQAAKAGGPDPNANARLREVLYHAKIAAVPKDIIDRNIKRASNKSQEDFNEIVYEARGPQGTGFVVECLTDSANRTSQTVRHAVSRGGGKMADPGSVLFSFQRKGVILIPDPNAEEQVYEAAMEAGADDIQPATDEEDRPAGFKVLTLVDEFARVRDIFREQSLPIDEEQSGLTYVPLSTVEVDEVAFEENEALLEKILAVEDVDAVYTSCAGLAH